MNTALLSFIFKLLIIPMGFFMIWAQDKFTWILYCKYPELWEEMGAPGGIFWCPEGRRFRTNMMMTGRFWYENQFGLATEMALPEDIKKYYSLYIKLFASMLIILVLFIMSLFGFHLYETGISPSQVTPSQ